MQFKLLNEGGNIILKSSSGDDLIISPIDITILDKESVCNDLKQLLHSLNDLFNKAYDEILWSEKVINEGAIFNGSTRLLFEENKIEQYKTEFGDIDCIVPESKKFSFNEILNKLEDRAFGRFTLRGIATKLKTSTTQSVTVWEYRYNKDTTLNIQVDFEYFKFEGEYPPEFANFAKGSSIVDMHYQIKGVFHKLLLGIIPKDLSQMDDVVVLTPTSELPPNKIKISKDKEHASPISLLSFSVDRGLRYKYKIQYDTESDKPFKVSGKYLVKPIKSTKLQGHFYKTNIDDIFKTIFKKKPSSVERKQFFSFTGLCLLIKKHLSDSMCRKIILHLFDNLWGDDINGMYKFNPDADKTVKAIAWKYVISVFPYAKEIFDGDKVDGFYNRYPTEDPRLNKENTDG
jgi:hypothetical protein